MGWTRVLEPQRQTAIAVALNKLYTALDKAGRGRFFREVLGLQSGQVVHAWRTGRFVVPAAVLKRLYQHTGDQVFLLSAEEKGRYLDHPRTIKPLPDSDGWPDWVEPPAVVQGDNDEKTVAIGGVNLPVDNIVRALHYAALLLAAEPSLVDHPVIGPVAQKLRGPSDQPAVVERHPARDAKAMLEDALADLERLADLPAGHADREWARKHLPRLAMRVFRTAVLLGLEFPDDFNDLRRQLDTAVGIFSRT